MLNGYLNLCYVTVLKTLIMKLKIPIHNVIPPSASLPCFQLSKEGKSFMHLSKTHFSL